MSSWILVADLTSLHAEFDRLAPDRDHTSDGSIGDTAHQQEASDHNPDETGRTPYADADSINEVHAIDVDSDLRKPGWSMARAVGIIVGRHRAGLDNRLQNVIYNRTIWSRTWGWTPRPYNGPSPHIEHAHFSSRYGSGAGLTNPETDTRPWGLLEAAAAEGDDMPTVAEVQQAVEDGVTAVLFAGYHAAKEDATYQAASADDQKAMRNVRDTLRGIVGGPVDAAGVAAQVVAQLPAGEPLTEALLEQALRDVMRSVPATS